MGELSIKPAQIVSRLTVGQRTLSYNGFGRINCFGRASIERRVMGIASNSVPRLGLMIISLLFLWMGCSLASADGIEVRGFHLGMTLSELEKVIRRQIGTNLHASMSEKGVSFFSTFTADDRCTIQGGARFQNEKRFRQIAKLPGVEDLSSTKKGKKVLYFGLEGSELFSKLDDLKVDFLTFRPCMFGMKDEDPAFFDVFAKKYHVGQACFAFLPKKNGNKLSYCYVGNEVISFWRAPPPVPRIAILIAGPQSALAAQAKDAGITP